MQAKLKHETIHERLQQTEQRTTNQKLLTMEQTQQKIQAQGQRFEQKKQKLTALEQEQLAATTDLKTSLEKQLRAKQLEAEKNLREKQEKFIQKNKAEQEKLQKMNEYLAAQQKEKEEALQKKFEKEQKAQMASSQKMHESVNGLSQKVQQKFAVQQQQIDLQQQEKQFRHDLQQAVVSLRMQKAENFVQQKENVKQDISAIAQQNESLKSYIEYLKFFSPIAHLYKAGQLTDQEIIEQAKADMLQKKQPQKAAVQPAKIEKPEDGFQQGQKAISRLNKLMDYETRREEQRKAEMKNCPKEDREALLLKHQQERIKIAHQVEELKKQLK